MVDSPEISYAAIEGCAKWWEGRKKVRALIQCAPSSVARILIWVGACLSSATMCILLPSV